MQAAELRHPAGQPHLQVEDRRRAAAAGEEAHLVGEPPARGVDEVDHRQQVAVRALQDPDLLLARQLAPRAGLDGEVVRDDRDRAALDAPDAGDHAVGGQRLVHRGGQQPVLDERARVEQHGEPVADRHLVRPARRVAAGQGAFAAAATSAASARRSARRDPLEPRVAHEAIPLVRISSWISSVPPPIRRMRASR